MFWIVKIRDPITYALVETIACHTTQYDLVSMVNKILDKMGEDPITLHHIKCLSNGSIPTKKILELRRWISITKYKSKRILESDKINYIVIDDEGNPIPDIEKITLSDDT